MNEQLPVSRRHAGSAVAASVASTAALVASGRLHLAKKAVGTVITFGDGTSAEVYRETVLDVDGVDEPAALVVAFRLRAVSTPAGHAVFRAESILNTPLFVGFPGFVSKLWLTHDTAGCYRGMYQWDGAARANHYARCLWRVLALVSAPGSIRYRVLPGTVRDDLLSGAVTGRPQPDRWWAPTLTVPTAGEVSALRPTAGGTPGPGFAPVPERRR